MSFEAGQRVRILAEPTFGDDPRRGTVATVLDTGPNDANLGDEVEVTFPGGSAVYSEHELELAQ